MGEGVVGLGYTCIRGHKGKMWYSATENHKITDKPVSGFQVVKSKEIEFHKELLLKKKHFKWATVSEQEVLS